MPNAGPNKYLKTQGVQRRVHHQDEPPLGNLSSNQKAAGVIDVATEVSTYSGHANAPAFLVFSARVRDLLGCRNVLA